MLVSQVLTMCGPHHAVALITSHCKPVLRDPQLGCSVMERQQHKVGAEGSVEPTGDGFPGPVAALVKLLLINIIERILSNDSLVGFTGN